MSDLEQPPNAVSRRRALGGFATVLIAAAAASTPAAAELPSSVRLILGGNLGSTHDQYARLFAAELEHRGLVRRAIVDVVSRAGGKLAAKTLAESRPDGATIGLLPTGLFYSELLGESGVAYSLPSFRWIGSFDIESRMLVVSRRLGIRSVAELVAHQGSIATAAGSATSQSHYDALLLNRLIGTRLRAVPGFGGPLRFLALANGEVGATVLGLDAMRPVLDTGDVVPLLRLGDHALPAGMPNIPALREIVAPADLALAEIVQLQSRFGRWLCLPPGTPATLVEAWRAAFQAIATSARFSDQVVSSGFGRHDRVTTSGAAIEATLRAIKERESVLRPTLAAAIRCGELIAERGNGTC